MKGRAILTAREMAQAEQAAIDSGTPVEELMERAGRAIADIAWRIAGPVRTLILCGPGNNGGDGYVVARLLAERGCAVTVAAMSEPGSDAARRARDRFDGRIVPIDEAERAPLVVDALFGTGLTRPLDEDLADRLARLVDDARHGIAVDLPSGIETDSGALLSPVPHFDATVALGSLKPAHLLQPAAHYMGEMLLGAIGIVADSDLRELAKPRLAPPRPDDHKYSRGYVLVAVGEMAGAAGLTAAAAMRAGAGYVALAGDEPSGLPLALVHRQAAGGEALARLLEDDRIDVAAIGPGLGTSERAQGLLEAALESGRRLVLDADALNILADRGIAALSGREEPPILTPHAGEFARLFGDIEGSKVERARIAAKSADSVVVLKGNDTIIAAPDGRAAISAGAPSWLASAGTGDVLTGIVAARYARTGNAFEAACEAVWLHADAA
ncbi:MAG: NAD(P)H-hydrate dehydratase, partial [Parasphingopyxis sp.]